QGELEHRHVKRFYVRTNKITFAFQIAMKLRRRAILADLRRRDPTFTPRWEQKLESANAKRELDEAFEHCVKEAADRRQGDVQPPTPPAVHYEVSASQRAPVNVYAFVEKNSGDPVAKGYLPRLRDHLLRRVLDSDQDFFTREQQAGLEIYENRLYPHKVIRFHHSTYDMRRDQDSVNPRTHPDIMLLASGDDSRNHPYWYARVLDVFHVRVCYTGPGATRATRRWQSMDVLSVRWFKQDLEHACGFQHRRLPRITFVGMHDLDDTEPFGFVNPEDVIRASYLIPAFAWGRTSDYLGDSKLARRAECDKHGDGKDWNAYYVCMCVSIRSSYPRGVLTWIRGLSTGTCTCATTVEA
ncbi:hypothetical protein K466DRAFT_496115, partial [Polyporus arcularius HHB13444]